MKTMTVYRQSAFPADADTVFRLLTDLRTLQYIAAPYASFTPAGEERNIVWEEGRTFSFRFRLFCLLPFGTHTIRVVRFRRDGILTHETNTHIPVWNHRIRLKETADGGTLYSDEVEIGAGWKTLFVYCWAQCFYRHRQKKWLKLLKNAGGRLL